MIPVFTAADAEAIRGHGLTLEEAGRQIDLFRNPPPPIRLARAATLGDGIESLDAARREELTALWRDAAAAGRLTRFVPASGAASRMFAALAPLAAGEDVPEKLAKDVAAFHEGLRRFAFWPELSAAAAREGLDPRSLSARDAARLLLAPEGLGYAALPKGLLAFHSGPRGAVTPFEEHLVEAVLTTRDATGRARLHVTVSPEHRAGFDALLARVRGAVESRLGAALDVGFSFQDPATDTLAGDPAGGPFRTDEGELLFRPGGHGALLANLQALASAGADVVAVRNVDNVVPERRRESVVSWQRVLVGRLVELEREAAAAGDDRPRRVCGVVRNLGEPGGGPFWALGPNGETSLQIVESAQVSKEASQQAILKSATHFNPVDLVLSLRRRDGTPCDLPAFVDPATVFLAKKTHQGRDLLALERPGLWNGAMAGWRTVFVEVPAETFAPVKTVLDLLRPDHVG